LKGFLIQQIESNIQNINFQSKYGKYGNTTALNISIWIIKVEYQEARYCLSAKLCAAEQCRDSSVSFTRDVVLTDPSIIGYQ